METLNPVNDSDTGVTEAEVKDGRGKKKTERKRKRTHLGPRIKVFHKQCKLNFSLIAFNVIPHVLLLGAENSD